MATFDYATLRDKKTGALVDARLPVEVATRPFSAWDKSHYLHTKSEPLDADVVRKLLGRETMEDAWGNTLDIAAENMKAELVKLGYSEEMVKAVTSKVPVAAPVETEPLEMER